MLEVTNAKKCARERERGVERTETKGIYSVILARISESRIRRYS